MSTATPVVFIHGLWLHAESWTPWMNLFRQVGYVPLNPGWPGDGSTVEETRRHPERLAGCGVDEVTEHYAAVIRSLPAKPIAVGHSFGGLIAQKLLGMDLTSGAVAIDPPQMRGVRTLSWVQLKTAFPVLSNPANYSLALTPTPTQFHRGTANTVSKEESMALYEKFIIPGPGRPMFEAAFANLNKRTAAQANTLNPHRGPLLITGGGMDATIPEAITRSVHKQYRRACTVNEYKVFPDRGHSLVIDTGWKEVAEATLDWLARKGLVPEAALGTPPPEARTAVPGMSTPYGSSL